MAILALVMALASCALAYYLQKTCPPDTVKLRGTKMSLPSMPMVAGITDVYVNGDKYYAHCIIRDTGEVTDIEIDKAMMAAVPDAPPNDDEYDVLVEVLVYAKSSPGRIQYELAPEEIRFKLNIQMSQQPGCTYEQLEKAKVGVAFFYEIRLILITLAFVGVYQASRLSIVFSLAAMIISWENIIPIRFSNLEDCGIINIGRNKATSTKPAETVVQTDGPPPGFERWSEDRQYMHTINQQMASRRASIAQEQAQQQSGPEGPYGEDGEEYEDDGEMEPETVQELEPDPEPAPPPPPKQQVQPKRKPAKPAASPAPAPEPPKSANTVSGEIHEEDDDDELGIGPEPEDDHGDEDPFGDDSKSGIEQDELDDGFSIESSDDEFGDDDMFGDDKDPDTGKGDRQQKEPDPTPQQPADAKDQRPTQFGRRNRRSGREGFTSIIDSVLE